jgi:hypothetical protein
VPSLIKRVRGMRFLTAGKRSQFIERNTIEGVEDHAMHAFSYNLSMRIENRIDRRGGRVRIVSLPPYPHGGELDRQKYHGWWPLSSLDEGREP